MIWTRQPSQLNGDEWQERIGAAGDAGKWSYWRRATVRGTGRRSWSRYCSVPGIGETRNSRRTRPVAARWKRRRKDSFRDDNLSNSSAS